MVFINGEVVCFGGKYFDSEGYDFFVLMIGLEGLLGVVIEVMVCIL